LLVQVYLIVNTIQIAHILFGNNKDILLGMVIKNTSPSVIHIK